MRAQRIKRLEELVLEAAARLRRSAEVQKKLRETLARLEERNGELELQVKRFAALPGRQARVKSRLERLLAKLDKAAEV